MIEKLAIKFGDRIIENEPEESVEPAGREVDLNAENICQRCIDLICKNIRQNESGLALAFFYLTIPTLRALPLTDAVIDTFKGIIGYAYWLSLKEGDNSQSFLTEAMHDVKECIAHHDKDWYSPRTSAYVQFYVLTE